MEQVEHLLEDEDPMFLLRSPPSRGFAQLKTDLRGRACWTHEEDRKEAEHHLKVACDVYEKQAVRGRSFLHEHPTSAESWQDSSIKKIKELGGRKDQNGEEMHV